MSTDAPPPETSRPSFPEESFESLYEDAPCGYFSTRVDGTFLRVNRTMLAWTGYRSEQLVHKCKFRDLLTLGDQMFHETHCAPLIAMQGSVSEVAFDIVRADQSTFSALINAVLHRDEDGRPSAIRTVVIYATDRRRYERELLAERQRAELVAKTKTDFVAMLSHDIRTPLSAVVSVADALQMGDLSPSQSNYLRLLKRGTDNLMELVNNVLDNSKLESGKMQLELGTLNLRALLVELVERLRPGAQSKGLELWVALDPRVPTRLLGDTVKLSQIFTNLIGNAIKFTDRGWVGVTVDLLAERAGQVELAVSIADTGIGVDPKRLTDIFEEFTQAHDQTGRDFGGSGLGLAISKKLVQLHGGAIRAKRRPEGGSAFEFTLVMRVPRA